MDDFSANSLSVRRISDPKTHFGVQVRMRADLYASVESPQYGRSPFRTRQSRIINDELLASSTLSTCTVFITGHHADSMQPSSETNVIFNLTSTTTAIAEPSFVMATGSFDSRSAHLAEKILSLIKWFNIPYTF
ncbi:uncharacterized protein EI90DRAFT_3115382 [Cantharellus anzutake]|uniref:uncharacterized protein n=1 Tax=Cantharellus anzutake TaxID=1750568 RepID=UPI001905F1E1|nr:uncharacterized protein EI90DRAFT_3115382 [Cantharellus anzutake]KAF8342853.1 hypothetical protein EI90DRAFT_3115382 [Cantharellus anzutake]